MKGIGERIEDADARGGFGIANVERELQAVVERLHERGVPDEEVTRIVRVEFRRHRLERDFGSNATRISQCDSDGRRG